jgi:hypothetical protein
MEADRFADAWGRLSTVGMSSKEVLADVDSALQEQVTWLLRNGAALHDVAAAYPELTQAQLGAINAIRKGQDDFTKASESVANATLTLQQRINTIDGSIVQWAEHLLASGVSARDVGRYYGLADDQVKALEQDLKAQTAALKNNRDWLADAADAAKKLAEANAIAAAAVLAAFDAQNTAVLGISTSFGAWNKTIMGTISMLDAMGRSASDQTTKVKTLAGELISVAEAQKRWNPGQFDDV